MEPDPLEVFLPFFFCILHAHSLSRAAPTFNTTWRVQIPRKVRSFVLDFTWESQHYGSCLEPILICASHWCIIYRCQAEDLHHSLWAVNLLNLSSFIAGKLLAYLWLGMAMVTVTLLLRRCA